MKRKFLAIAALGAAILVPSALFSAQKTVVSMDFEDKTHFTVEKSSESGQIGDTRWVGFVSPGTDIRIFPDKKYNQALRLVQQEKNHGFSLTSAAAIPDNCNHTITFDTYLEKGSFLSFSGRDKNSSRLLALMFTGNAIPKVLHNG